MPKLRPNFLRPTDKEEAAINRGIAADPDNPEWTAEDFARAKPAREVAPEVLKAFAPPNREPSKKG